MKTNSVLTAGKYTEADYTAAENERVILTPPPAQNWLAPQFVWQVRHQLGTILCPATPDACEQVDTGGYKVITTLDYRLQSIAEKWVKAAGIAPNQKDTAAYLKSINVPYQQWIRNLKGRGIYNAALGAIDYRTGEVVAYVGSADYYAAPRGAKFQPQFDVLANGWRQPGSSFKAIGYLAGIEDHVTTAATMFMDVVTNFGGGYAPADADLTERGPVRLREAIELSLNIPAIKAAIIEGPDKVFNFAKQMGIVWQSEVQPRWGVDRNRHGRGPLHRPDRGVRRHRQLRQADAPDDDPVGHGPPSDEPGRGDLATGQRPAARSPGRQPPGGLHHAGHPGLEHRPEGRTRSGPIGPSTTARSAARPPSRPVPRPMRSTSRRWASCPAQGPQGRGPRGRAWMGNSDNSAPPNGTVALETAASLWQAFLEDAVKGTPVAAFAKPPAGVVQATVDAYSGLLPGPFTTRTVKEYFIDGTVPKQVDNTKVGVQVDSATGLRWQDGCLGPEVTKGFLDFSNVEPTEPSWVDYTQGWVAPGRARPGRARRPEAHSD